MRDVAGKLALPMGRDDLGLVAGIVHNFDLARVHDEEAHLPVADAEEGLSVPEELGLGLGAARELTDLRLIECRECNREKILFAHSSGLNSENEDIFYVLTSPAVFRLADGPAPAAGELFCTHETNPARSSRFPAAGRFFAG